MTDAPPMVEVFVARMFAIRDAAHLAHWSATGAGSYAAHQALGSFYDELIDKLDTYVETYQGYFGLIKAVQPVPYAKESIAAQIRNEAQWLSENCGTICRENEALENIYQDICALFAQTYYKLRYLA